MEEGVECRLVAGRDSAGSIFRAEGSACEGSVACMGLAGVAFRTQ